MTDDQIKYMVNRFLSWQLPWNFNPDGGISFQPVGNEGTSQEYQRRPSGTNLLDAAQAEAMVRHIADGTSDGRNDVVNALLMKAADAPDAVQAMTFAQAALNPREPGGRLNDIPIPDKLKVEAALARIDDDRTTDDWNEIDEAARWALHALGPDIDFLDATMRNPISQVFFRAGLLACREYMARFVEQGGDAAIAQSIRANWWPKLGDDPGAPRLFDFAEVAEEREAAGKTVYVSPPMTPSQEALPYALQFLSQAKP